MNHCNNCDGCSDEGCHEMPSGIKNYVLARVYLAFTGNMNPSLLEIRKFLKENNFNSLITKLNEFEKTIDTPEKKKRRDKIESKIINETMQKTHIAYVYLCLTTLKIPESDEVVEFCTVNKTKELETLLDKIKYDKFQISNIMQFLHDNEYDSNIETIH
jgi:hypothetical protein